MLKDDFLQQNGMSEYDRYCPFYKTSGMLRNFVEYHEAAIKAVSQGDVTFNKVKDSTGDLSFKLSQMKFEVSIAYYPGFPVKCLLELQSPSQGKDSIKQKLDVLYTEIQDRFRQLGE